jgi:hypothetical protein
MKGMRNKKKLSYHVSMKMGTEYEYRVITGINMT